MFERELNNYLKIELWRGGCASEVSRPEQGPEEKKRAPKYGVAE
jgi:hypothetical protein